jgi:AcrR family transcriptional regulator
MAVTPTGRPGRPAAASKEDALALATRCFLRGERVDVQAIAETLGLARATMHRWFGTRDRLIGEMLAALGEERLRAIRARSRGSGARVLLSTFDTYNRELAGSEALRLWLSREQERALRVLTSSGGIVQPRMVAAIQRLIDAEIEAGAFDPRVPAPTLAYAIVRLAEAFLYNDAMAGIRGDTDRLRELEAALLGIRRAPARRRQIPAG